MAARGGGSGPPLRPRAATLQNEPEVVVNP